MSVPGQPIGARELVVFLVQLAVLIGALALAGESLR